jgi:hypothetical protein
MQSVQIDLRGKPGHDVPGFGEREDAGSEVRSFPVLPYPRVVNEGLSSDLVEPIRRIHDLLHEVPAEILRKETQGNDVKLVPDRDCVHGHRPSSGAFCSLGGRSA